MFWDGIDYMPICKFFLGVLSLISSIYVLCIHTLFIYVICYIYYTHVFDTNIVCIIHHMYIYICYSIQFGLLKKRNRKPRTERNWKL